MVLMSLKIFIIFWGLFSLSPKVAVETCSLSKKEIKEVGKHFNHEESIEILRIAVERASYPQLIREGDCIYTVLQGGKILGYLLSTQAKGRFDYFDYSVIYSEDLSVLGLVVTVYRSTHGAGICQKKWLQQFVGYNGGELSLGKDINAITGATFSATSMVEDIQRCQHLILRLKEDQAFK